MTDILYERSRVVTDWKCPRARYWNYEFEGKGITKATTAIELFTGITVHDCLAAIALSHPSVDIDNIASTAALAMRKQLMEANEGEVGAEEFAQEQAALTEGMLRGFYKHVWARLIDGMVIKYVEQEVMYKHDGLVFMSKPDLILENSEGDWVYIEYKTTANKKDDWINSWDTAVQLHSACRAVGQTLGQEPTIVQVVGLYKGYQSYGKQSSPFCYAYVRKGSPPFIPDQVEYEYRAGLRRSATWEMEGGVKAWVAGMPENVLANQFPMPPPIFVNSEMVDSFFRQRAARELEIHNAQDRPVGHDYQNMLNVTFPQKFDQCKPGWGKKCEFLKLCFGRCDDPLKEGYAWRQPHHEAEMEQDGGLDGSN